jgi:hypothetical protein
VQCKVERFDQVQGLQRFCPDLPHDSRSFVLCQARQVLYNNVSSCFLISFYGNDGTKFLKKAERRLSLVLKAVQLEGNTENGESLVKREHTNNDPPRNTRMTLKQRNSENAIWAGSGELQRRGSKQALLELGSSGDKTRPDYSGYQDWRKRDLIATIPELLSRAVECVAR